MKYGALAALVSVAAAFAAPVSGASFTFTTGSPDGAMAMATRPASAGVEIEPADDFVLSSCTTLTSATFFGLIAGGATLANVTEVDVEIYRIFPLDSDTTRTITVPTRSNSPSDVALVSRASTSGGLTFTGSTINPSFTASNSVLNGIHPMPNQTTGGEGPVSGQEVSITATFTTPITLPAGHYFIVPQVAVPAGSTFYWLSAPFLPPGFSGDLQTWIRNAPLEPDWLRVGTDIVGGPTPPKYNAAFSLAGNTVTIGITPSNPSPLSATEGAAIPTTTFTGSGGAAPYTFTATGLPGGVTLTSGGTLSGTPADEGTFSATITATDAGGCSASIAYTINVADAALTGTPATILFTPAMTFSGPVATLHDANTAAPAGDFTATIDWGDGTTTAGAITANGGGNFTVSGTHVYSTNGPFTVTVVIHDAGGSAVTVSSTAILSTSIPALGPAMLLLLAALLAVVALRHQ
jgi:hypothetical protein